MLKTWILQNFLINGTPHSKRCTQEWFVNSGHSDKLDEIISQTGFLTTDNIIERIYYILNDKNVPQKCLGDNCHNIPKFKTLSKGFREFCSAKCSQSSTLTQEKTKTTFRKKYGCDYALSNEEIKNKSKITLKKKYGANIDNVSQISIIKKKKIETCRMNHGVNYYLSKQKEKEEAINKKYGCKNIQHVQSMKDIWVQKRRGDFYDHLLKKDEFSGNLIPSFTREEYIQHGYYHTSYKFKCGTCQTEFDGRVESAKYPRCPKCFKGVSCFEMEVFEFLKTMLLPTQTIIRNDRNILLNGKEIDILLPDYKIAIECDGLYWHGELGGAKTRNYHLAKTNEAAKAGYRMIHIFEDDWLYKKEIVKSRLTSILGKTPTKIMARKCGLEFITHLTDDITKVYDFIEKNHIQGDLKSNRNKYFVLKYNGEIVAAMSFGELRKCVGGKKEQGVYELYRFCSKLNTAVVGGATKMFNEFLNLYEPKTIITYSDLKYNTGNVYEKMGFYKTGVSAPSYWYFGRDDEYKRIHRFAFSKHTLSKKLKIFDASLSEWENMKLNGYDRIWDCGNNRYEWNSSTVV